MQQKLKVDHLSTC